MENFNKAAEAALDMYINYFNDRLKDLNMNLKDLSEKTEIPYTTLYDNFKKKNKISLLSFFKICGALHLNPYLVPKELDDNKKSYINFN